MKIIRINNELESKINSINSSMVCGSIEPFRLKDGSLAIGADILEDAEKQGFWRNALTALKGMPCENIDASQIVKNDDA